MPLKRRPRIGLALGAGIARGWAHIGVLRALDDAGIRPDIIAGTSIGAVAGATYAGGVLDRLEGFARGLTARGMLRYLDVRLAASGLIGGERLSAELSRQVPAKNLEDLDVPFVAVATDLETGNEVWLSEGPLVPAVRASYALPGVFPPVRIDGRQLIDGAIVNPIPVSACRAFGADIVIGVNFDIRRAPIRPSEPRMDEIQKQAGEIAREADAGSSSRATLFRQFFGGTRTGPGLSTVMLTALTIMLDRITRARLAGDPPDLMIAPKLAHVGLLDFYKADIAIAAGHAATQEILPDLQALLPEGATRP